MIQAITWVTIGASCRHLPGLKQKKRGCKVMLDKWDGMLFQTCFSQVGGETAQTPTDPSESFYLLWLHQLNNFSPLSLLHLPLHRSQQSAYCPLLLKFHPEISHREQSVPVVGTRP